MMDFTLGWPIWLPGCLADAPLFNGMMDFIWAARLSLARFCYLFEADSKLSYAGMRGSLLLI